MLKIGDRFGLRGGDGREGRGTKGFERCVEGGHVEAGDAGDAGDALGM